MHRTVLVEESVGFLAPKVGGVYLDGTLGGGGHADAILGHIGGQGRLLGVDRDTEALERAAARLAPWGKAVTLVHGNFADMESIGRAHGFEHADGIVLDIGVSSDQLDTVERGFSFQEDADLDMRMDRNAGETAADLLASLPVDALTRLLREYGEEPKARSIATAIVRQREDEPITRTGQLAELVARASGWRQSRRHPATRTFQALRIAVNDELAALETGLEGCLRLLKDGGRLVVIAFHSLEDRIVKHFFKRHAGRWESLQAGGQRWVGETPPVRVLTKRPVVASGDEQRGNPRSRSAKLRAAERLAVGA